MSDVPAKDIKYRYNEELIAAHRNITWWEWYDEKIKECHEDFYSVIDEFL